MSTPEQHQALLQEIICEMTPGQIRAALAPHDWERELQEGMQVALAEMQQEFPTTRLALLYPELALSPYPNAFIVSF